MVPETSRSEAAFVLDDQDVVVHQATGMVLAQLDVSAGEALARLRAFALARERLLVDVARDVVERRLAFGAGPDTVLSP